MVSVPNTTISLIDDRKQTTDKDNRILNNFEHISKIDFSIYSPQICKQSKISDPDGIIIPELYDNAEPLHPSIYPFTSSNINFKCGICGENTFKCLGHEKNTIINF